MIKNAPKSIFLVTGYEKRKKVDFSELFEVTWNSGKIYEGDLEYISKDFLLSFLAGRLKQIAQEKANQNESSMQGGKNMHRLRGIKKELEYLIKEINGAS